MLGRVLGDDLRAPIGRRVLVHVDLGGPVHLRIKLLSNQELTGGAVERVAKAVAIEMHQGLAVGTADVLIRQDHLVDAVEVPLVVGRHLIDPARHASVGIARPDGHRPLVVAGALLRVPGRGIAGAVVDQVELRIVGHPAPGAAASCFPLLAFPRLEARILADRLAELRRLDRIDQELVVRPLRIGAPRLLAGLEIVGGDMARDAELAAGDADEHFVLHHHRRRRAGLAFRRIAVLGLPDHLPVLGIECHERGVGLVQEDLAVRISKPAIDGIAAHHRNDVRILRDLVFPKDLAVMVEVECEYRIRERAVHVHDVANDQRAALVAAQHAGRERPGHLQLADVLRVDLLELRVAMVRVVAGRHHPLFRVLRHLDEVVIGLSRAGGARRGYAQARREQDIAHWYPPCDCYPGPARGHKQCRGSAPVRWEELPAALISATRRKQTREQTF